ncbi:MAG TPA: hypothetical protein VML75_01285, partial [Kofleriaceae bacterium]|nr:hypothetical protein [Kofleriaceae bacterium]
MSDLRPYGSAGHDSGMLSPDQRSGYAELRQLGLFDGIPNAALERAIGNGSIERRVVRRDAFVADPVGVSTGDARVMFVYRGQVAAGVFDPNVLSDRLAEQHRYDAMTPQERDALSLLPPPPLA